MDIFQSTIEVVLFQLHHTGIKTCAGYLDDSARTAFQLHHTGIKTKRHFERKKPENKFQLHHTGIKTY